MLDDARQALAARMLGCSVMGTLSPNSARAFASLSQIVGECSQWVTTMTGARSKIRSNATGSSTSMSPVEAPMNALIPQASPTCSALISSMLRFVAPR
jgi:hypothetical protein